GYYPQRKTTCRGEGTAMLTADLLRSIVIDHPDRSDVELLLRFAERRDEGAFEALLQRHGPAVWGLCRRALPTEADAEDVFQATFLELARKAGSLRRPASVGGWLFAVA